MIQLILTITYDMLGCFCLFLAPSTHRAVSYTQFEDVTI
jgi:hypothetical protein